MTSPSELQSAMLAESRRLQQLIDDQPRLVREEADAERLADLAEATTLTSIKAEDALEKRTRTVQEYEAIVTKACVGERYAFRLSEGLRKSNELAIRGSMQKLSALQSLASAMREEARLSRVGDGP